ncbi:MAG TPA: SulP family inorganic anion transporter [Bacteroidia bacterium]|jgi:MFS superfamily sulfate permease-like transporter|nr:SulP family inorganic anion transporter [Bacteroidia bacterium]
MSTKNEPTLTSEKIKDHNQKNKPMKKLIPKDGWEGLRENFTTDALSGFLVFLLALPLSLGIAKASLYPTLFGLVTAIVGGVIVSFFMGSRLSIKGPAAGMIVIASGSVSAFEAHHPGMGWQLALGAVVVAGLIQIAFGVLKLGNFADFFPGAAIHGMLAAIGVIIMAKQLHLLMGINPAELKGKEPLELLAMLPASVMHENAHMTEIGIACLLILVIMGFVKNQHIKKIPAPLIVLAVSIPLGFALHIKTDGAIANFALVKVGSIFDAFKNGIINADFSGLSTDTGIFIQYVVLYALIGSIESLLTAKAVDGMDPYKRKTNFNKDLWAVGLGNTISGLLGGLPMISEVARSSANVSYGAKTRWANFFHGLFLLLAVLFAVPLIEMIPNVALAAMLVFVGFRLAHPREFKHMWHIGMDQFFIFVTTLIITLATDLLIGVGSGIVLEILVNLIHGAKLGNLFKSKTEVQEQGNQIQMNVKGDAVFSNFLGLKKKIYALPHGKHVSINLSNCGVIDHTTLHSLNDFKNDYQAEGGMVIISGHEHHSHKGHDTTSTRVKKH